jgi:hypothetical protein
MWRGRIGEKPKSGSGQIRSRVVAGFEILIRSLFDAEENLRALRAMLGDSATAA